MRIAAQIREHLFGSGEWPFCVHGPRPPQSFADQSGKAALLRKSVERTMEAKLAITMEVPKTIAEPGSKHFRKRPHRKQVTSASRAEALAIITKTTCGDNAVQVVMFAERLAPSMQYGCDPNLAAEAFPAEVQQSTAGAGKEQPVERCLILPDKWIEHVRQRENDMEVRHRQETLPLTFQPFLGPAALAAGTMPVAATVRHEVLGTAIRAAVPVPAKPRRAAGEDRSENLVHMLTQG